MLSRWDSCASVLPWLGLDCLSNRGHLQTMTCFLTALKMERLVLQRVGCIVLLVQLLPVFFSNRTWQHLAEQTESYMRSNKRTKLASMDQINYEASMGSKNRTHSHPSEILTSFKKGPWCPWRSLPSHCMIGHSSCSDHQPPMEKEHRYDPISREEAK